MEKVALETFAACCAAADDGLAVSDCGLSFYESFGIDWVSYHGDTVGSPAVRFQHITQKDGSRRWRSEILDVDMLRDSPVETLARRSGQPFWWSQVEHMVRLTPEEMAYMQRLAETCQNDGLSMHVYGPQGSSAVVGLGFAKQQHDLTAQDLFVLHGAAQMAHLRYCALVINQPPRDVGLSPREIEVLQWITTGKSNSVIADILGISRHTVDTIVRRIFAKLSVNDRTSAAIRALATGMLPKRDVEEA